MVYYVHKKITLIITLLAQKIFFTKFKKKSLVKILNKFRYFKKYNTIYIYKYMYILN
jgi:hypothetical protein